MIGTLPTAARARLRELVTGLRAEVHRGISDAECDRTGVDAYLCENQAAAGSSLPL